jgi:two-component system phosphate regulon sensor histidine kinase PhoR
MMQFGIGTLVLLVLLLLVCVPSILLLVQLRQRRQLRIWLNQPEVRNTPDGIGAWRDIFTRLQRLRKEDHIERIALASSRDRFRLMVQTMPDGIILLDGNDHIEWMNATACRQFGLDAQRDAGTLIEQLIRHSLFIEYLTDFRAGRQRDPLVLALNGDQPKCVLSISLFLFGDAGGLLLARDITEIARAETIRRDFIANVSHELRTPLTVISGFLEQLTSENAPPAEAARGFLVLMNEQAQRMNRLVEDLLTLSRLENASTPPREERVNVPALMQTLLIESRALSGSRHTIELGEVAPCWVQGSPDELRSAFGNLVSNAVRYTPAGGSITLSWSDADGSPTFAVTDTGIGIPPEHVPRLSERFYRVDKGRSAASGGTGLGLAIVKHVLARHQGALLIRSEVGRGSTFSACLPAARLIRV